MTLDVNDPAAGAGNAHTAGADASLCVFVDGILIPSGVVCPTREPPAGRSVRRADGMTLRQEV